MARNTQLHCGAGLMSKSAGWREDAGGKKKSHTNSSVAQRQFKAKMKRLTKKLKPINI
jgi:hypothetical protein